MLKLEGEGWKLNYFFDVKDVKKTRMGWDSLADSKYRVYCTLCGISMNEGKTWEYGMAQNSTKDQFVKKIGMVLSFSRALSNLVKDRNLRKEIFRKFWEKHGKRLYGKKIARVV